SLAALLPRAGGSPPVFVAGRVIETLGHTADPGSWKALGGGLLELAGAMDATAARATQDRVEVALRRTSDREAGAALETALATLAGKAEGADSLAATQRLLELLTHSHSADPDVRKGCVASLAELARKVDGAGAEAAAASVIKRISETNDRN